MIKKENRSSSTSGTTSSSSAVAMDQRSLKDQVDCLNVIASELYYQVEDLKKSNAALKQDNDRLMRENKARNVTAASASNAELIQFKKGYKSLQRANDLLRSEINELKEVLPGKNQLLQQLLEEKNYTILVLDQMVRNTGSQETINMQNQIRSLKQQSAKLTRDMQMMMEKWRI